MPLFRRINNYFILEYIAKMSSDQNGPPQIPPRDTSGDVLTNDANGLQQNAQQTAGTSALHPGRNPVHLNYLQAPQRYKKGQDLLLFLRRFESYANAFGADADTRKHWLVNLLCDNTLQAIERYLTPTITYAEITEVLRRVQGLMNQNKEIFIQKLRKTKREDGEDIRDFYTKIYELARKCYPGSDEIKNHMVREIFVNHLQCSEISSRLREHPNATNEELLELAVTLEGCRQANDLAISVGAVNTDTAVGTAGTVDINNRMETLINMLHNCMTMGTDQQFPTDGRMENVQNEHGNSYSYTESMRTRGLPSTRNSRNNDYNTFHNNYRNQEAGNQRGWNENYFE